MEDMSDSAKYNEAAAVADLVKFLGGMLLMASILFLVLGGIGYEQDRRVRYAMIKTVGTVTGEYEYGGAYYVIYEADGTAHEALMDYYKGKLNVGDQVDIRYHPEYYNDVRYDGPKAIHMKILGYAALGLCLGGLTMLGQLYLRNKHANPWHEAGEDNYYASQDR